MAGMSVSAQWGTNGTNIYYNGGNVGIGTSTPSNKLTIYDNAAGTGLLIDAPYSGSANRGIGSIRLSNSTSGDMFNIAFRYRSSAYEMLQSVYSVAKGGWLEYCYLNLTTGNYEMRSGVANAEFKNTGNILFNNTGAIGIGTGAVAIPAGVKLAINGKLNAKEVEVTLSGWSDFVFDEDYKLKPLNEVERFIKENKHLPDVPSAKEVMQNGTNLGEMDAILLQKIEELTLYVIDLKNENDILKQKISSFEK